MNNKTCDTCKFCGTVDNDDRQLFCMRYPPTAFPVSVLNRMTQEQSMAIQSSYTPIPNTPCGEYLSAPVKLELKP